MKLFGYKVNVLHVGIAALVVLLITHLIGGCCDCNVEGLQMLGADISYKMGEGVKGSWETRQQQQGSSSLAYRQQDHDSYNSKFVGPDQNLNFFADTDFAPECCGSNYSANGGLRNSGASTGGCACMNTQQINYINQRGGNRTMPGSEF